jgi:hypothetical protein
MNIARTESPSKRLSSIVREALDTVGPRLDDAIEFVDIRIGNDGALLREVVGDALRDHIRRRLAKAAVEDRATVVDVRKHKRGKPDVGGRMARDTHRSDAPGADNGGQLSGDTHVAPAATDGGGRNARATQDASAPPSDSFRKGQIAAHLRGANSLLASFSVAGLPLRYATRSQCLAEATGYSVKARFLRLVASRVPDTGIVGDHLDDDSVTDAMERARQKEIENA